MNPYLDAAQRIELGDRALAELMTPADWQEILGRTFAGPCLICRGETAILLEERL